MKNEELSSAGAFEKPSPKTALTKWVVVVFLFGILFMPNLVCAERLNPDVWYRLFDWKTPVRDMFFADEDIWGDEPVLIIGKNHSSFADAIGFFSGRKHELKATKISSSKGGYDKDLWQYRYIKLKRPLKKRLARLPLGGLQHDGSRYVILVNHILSEGTADKELNHIIPSNLIVRMLPINGNIHDRPVNTYAIQTDRSCEPMTDSIAKLDQRNNIIWAKTIVRYYSKGELAPFYNEEEHGQYMANHCGDYQELLPSQMDMTLVLNDGTMLVAGSTAVARIDMTDGNMKEKIPNLKALNAEDVLRAKLAILRGELAKNSLCAKKAARIFKVSCQELAKEDKEICSQIKAGSIVWQGGCDDFYYFDIEDNGPELLYRDLATLLFEQN